LKQPETTMENQFTIEMAQEFHRRMATIVDAIQVGIWQSGRRDLLGYDSDYGFGQDHGQQTLVLKTGRRSVYLRLDWNTILGDSPADRQLVDEAVRRAIYTLG
jgi:hypothetical protein